MLLRLYCTHPGKPAIVLACQVRITPCHQVVLAPAARHNTSNEQGQVKGSDRCETIPKTASGLSGCKRLNTELMTLLLFGIKIKRKKNHLVGRKADVQQDYFFPY